MMLARIIIFSVACFCLITPAKAQVEVSAQLDSTHMLIGDQMRLHLRIDKSQEAQIKSIDLTAIGKEKAIEVLNISPWDSISNNGATTLRQDLTITAFDSGQVWIPSIPVVYEFEGKQNTAYTNKLPLSISTIETDSSYLAPIKPILEEPFKIQDVMPYVAAILVVVGLFAGGYYLFRKKKEPGEAPEKEEVKQPAHEIALAKLAALKKAKLWQQEMVKEYQSELTYITREYLENRYGIQALESTTDEILIQLSRADIPAEFNEKLKEMLQLADLVKFAKARPPADVHDRLMGYAEDFVIKTKQRVVEEVQDH